jgi:hypothetical protein
MQQATHFDGILEQSRDLICERLDQALAGMLDNAKEALSALIDGTRNFEERRLYEDARAVAIAQRETMEKEFEASYLGEFRRRSDRARKIGQAFGEADDSLGQLALVGEDDFEETLKFNDMAAKLRAYCDEELVALDQRVGVLLGDANLEANDNPFSPQVICDAYKHACRHVDADAGVRRVLLKLFDDHVLDDIRSMYKAVNALLVQNSILPRIRYSVSRSQDRTAPAPGAPASGETPVDAPASDITTNVAQDFFAILQNLAASHAVAIGQQGVGRGAGAVGAQAAAGAVGTQAGAAVLQGAELQRSLTQIQLGDLSGVAGGSLTAPAGVPGTTNVLHELKATSVGAGMGSVDLMTLDIIAMLFDQLFDDPKVPNGVKGLIGRMQIPMLKVAIADKSFFSTKTHPARRLLDKLGEIASRLPADFSPADPLFARLQSILEELVEGFHDNLEIFASMRERVEALLDEEDRRIEEEARVAASAAAKRVEEVENLAVAKRSAEVEVKARVRARKLPGPVLEFLVQQWLKLLLLLHVKEGKESQAWKGALEVMDQLIWSVEPKSTREERRAVAEVIPALVRQLAAGLKAAGIEDDVRARFFAELIKYHKQAITAPVEGKPDPASAAQAAPSQAESPTASGHQTASPREAKAAASGSPDFSAPITVRNPFGDGDVNVDSLDLDFTALEAATRPQRDSGIAYQLAKLTVGTWVEFRETADQPVRRPARLIFVSPRKTRYLFAVDRAGKDIIQCTSGEISRRCRVGDAGFFNEPRVESLFDRIMKGLVGKLRAPAAGR